MGDLAVAVGMINLEQLEAIHRRRESAGEPFSMAAVHLAYPTEPQIAQLLHPQSAERLLLGQILLAFGYLDRATLKDALKAHTTERDEDDFALMRAFRQSGLVEVGPTCASALRGVFLQSIGGGLSFQAIPSVKAVSAGQAVWSQGISRGEDRFILGLQIPSGEARAIAAAVLGIDVKALDDLARDAVGGVPHRRPPGDRAALHQRRHPVHVHRGAAAFRRPCDAPEVGRGGRGGFRSAGGPPASSAPPA
jgi:hypothetical protein